MEKLEEILSKTFDIPSHSNVVFKVIKLLDNEYLSIRDIEDFLSYDKGFASKFLRIANSPFYGMTRKIKTVKEALVLLGINTAKSLILATSSRYLYKRFGDFEQSLWEHSLGVGICSSFLASLTKLAEPEESLCCGILHDIGKVFLNNAMPDDYPKLYKRIINSEKSSAEIENEIFAVNHVEVGVEVSMRWNFPEVIQKVIEYHHQAPYPYDEDTEHKNICNIVRIANHICHKLGIGFKKYLPNSIDLEDIGLDSSSLEEIEKIFLSQFNEQKDLLIN